MSTLESMLNFKKVKEGQHILITALTIRVLYVYEGNERKSSYKLTLRACLFQFFSLYAVILPIKKCSDIRQNIGFDFGFSFPHFNRADGSVMYPKIVLMIKTKKMVY